MADMSSHADTIRLRHFVNNAALLNDSPVTQAEATEALDALLAENQRLREREKLLVEKLAECMEARLEALAGDAE